MSTWVLFLIFVVGSDKGVMGIGTFPSEAACEAYGVAAIAEAAEKHPDADVGSLCVREDRIMVTAPQ